MFVYHKCSVCGFIGEVETVMKTVTCPQCQTVNDVWFDGEEPPLNHLYQMYATETEKRYKPKSSWGLLKFW